MINLKLKLNHHDYFFQLGSWDAYSIDPRLRIHCSEENQLHSCLWVVEATQRSLGFTRQWYHFHSYAKMEKWLKANSYL